MRLLCVHCDCAFESIRDDAACPKCSRQDGIESLGTTAIRSTSRFAGGRLRLGLLAALVLFVAVGSYGWWSWSHPAVTSGEAPLRPLSSREVHAYLEFNEAGADAAKLAAFLAPTDAIEEFAGRTTEGHETARDKAAAVAEAFTSLRKRRAFVAWPRVEPRPSPIDFPSEVLTALTANAELRLYPLEVAALGVAALRSVGVDAMVAQVYGMAEDSTPVDPSGELGYFGFALVGDGGSVAARHVWDPFGGERPAFADVRVLTDLQVIAAALGHKAAHAEVHEHRDAYAMRLVDIALRLDPKSATLHSARGGMLGRDGRIEEAVRAHEAAVRLRPDAPQELNFALVQASLGARDAAMAAIGGVLEKQPAYARARATEAALRFALGQLDQGKRALDRAERLDPQLPSLPLIKAIYYEATGSLDQAVEHAGRASKARPWDLSTRIQVARIYRSAGRYDAMRREVRDALEPLSAARRRSAEELVRALLGPTALEDPDDLEADQPALDEAVALPSVDLDLGSESVLLGGKAASGQSGPGLLGEGQEGPALLLGKPSDYRLRDPSQRLKLDLN